MLSGSTSGTVTIANNANIILSDAEIGGIVCEGSATITLVGTNNVSGATDKAGIQVGGSGTTLTIKGNGSLTANGGRQSAGIGLSRAWDVDAAGGDIVIEGGNITATGDNYGAGIGTGVSWGNTSDKTATIGNITIKGGSVRAIGGTHQSFPGSGIGKGGAYSYGHAVVGTITIYDGIDMVDATSISESVTYMHDETDVTANASNYFTITEDGDRRIIAPKDDADYIITIADGIEHGTLTGAATAKYMEKVTITATPDLGYRLSRLVVKDADNNDVATTGNSFFMPKGGVTVSAVFEQGVHGTTEFAWGYFGPSGIVREASIYDGLTTVNLQQGQPYQIFKYDNEYSYRNFLLDNSTYDATIPYSGGTGTFSEYGNGTNFKVDYNGESGFYDFTMTDVGNDKWSVSIQKTVPVVADIPDQEYTGSEITTEPLVMAGSLSLTKGTDYEYSYTDNTNAGTAKVTVTFKGDYESLGSVEKEFNIVRATPTVTAPTANTLTYNGGEQELVTAGSTNFGKVLYSLDGETYSEKVPKVTSAGDYTVFYKVEGSDNWNAVEPQTVEVTIAESYTITWKNGDEILETDNYVPGGAAPEYNGNAPTKGTTAQYTYTFSGWSDGTNTYAPNALPAVSGDVTYTAQFDSEVNKYTVTWKNGDTVLETDENVPYGTTPTYNGEAPTKTADAQYTYTFSGWSDGTNTYASDALPTVSGDVTYTAQFNSTAKTYTITYKVDGEVYDTKTISYGDSITLLDVPTREGYTFSGWQTSYTTMPASNIEITGTFAINTYAVNFVDADGVTALADAQTVSLNENASAPAAPTKNGAIFLGWTADGVNTYDFETPVTAETTLTAMWLDASGFITFSEGYAVTDNTYNGTDRDYVGFRFDVNMDNTDLTVVQHGILYGMNIEAFGNGKADANLRFTDDSASALMDKVREFAAQNTDTETTDWIEVYIGDCRDGVVYARGFIIVTDGTNKYLIYSDVQEGSYNSFSE